MSDYETAQRRRNLVVGLFVIIGFCALVWLIFRFGDLPGFVTQLDSFQVYVQFPTASGVQKDTPVQFCGYQIGRVTQVMAPEEREEQENGQKTGRKYYQTVVVLSIDKRYQTIPSNVKIKMMMRGLGSSYIEIEQNPDVDAMPLDPNRPETVFLYDGAWMQGTTGMTSEFFPEESQEKLAELINGVNLLVANANDVIGSQANKDNFREILANLNEATREVQKTLEDIQALAASGTSTLQHVDMKIDEVVTALVDTSDNIQQLADSGTSTLQHVDSKIDEVVTAFVDTSEDFREFTSAGTATLDSIDAKAERLVVAMIDTSEQLSGSLSELRLILGKVNDGTGTAGKLLNDGRFYENLIENTEQLELMLEEMKEFIEEWKEKDIRITLF